MSFSKVDVLIDGSRMASPKAINRYGQQTFDTGFSCTDSQDHSVEIRNQGSGVWGASHVVTRWNINCLTDTPWGLFTRYGWTGFSSDSEDLAVYDVHCGLSRVKLKTLTTNAPNVKAYGMSGRGIDLSQMGKSGDYWEYEGLPSNDFYKISVNYGGKTARTYCSTYDQINYNVRDIGFLVNGSLVKEIIRTTETSVDICLKSDQ